MYSVCKGQLISRFINYPIAKIFLNKFIISNSIDSTYINSNILYNDNNDILKNPQHKIGIDSNDDGSCLLKVYNYDSSTEISKNIATSSEFKEIIKNIVFQDALINNANSGVIERNKLADTEFPGNTDLGFALGQVDILNTRIEYNITHDVNGKKYINLLSVECVVEDIYDFQYIYYSLSRLATILQSSYIINKNRGEIFKNVIHINYIYKDSEIY